MSIESRFFDYDVEPDFSRVIAPPISTPEDDAATARIRRNARVIAVVCFAMLAALLECFGAEPFQRIVP